MNDNAIIPVVPDSWRYLLVKDAIDKISITNRKLKQKEYLQQGNLPVIDQGRELIGGYANKEEMKISSETPLIIFGDHTRIFKYIPFDFVAGADGVKVLKPKGIYLSKLLFYFLQGARLPDKGYARHYQYLEKANIPLPPFPEQHRIVAKIEELFTKIEAGGNALKQVQAQLKCYRQSILKAAVEGSLTAEWREQHMDELEPVDKLLERIQEERKGKLGKKYKETISVDTSDLPKLPEEWAWATWEQILSSDEGSFKRGPFGSSLKKSMFVESGYKVYEQYCPINDDCSFARYFITKEKFLEMKAFSVREKDFLISCSGVTLGRITQVPKEYDEGIINQALLRVRINESVVTSPFFIKFFRSPYFQKIIFEHSTGTAIPNVKGVKELKAIPVPLPSLLEQRIIVNEIERLFSILDKSESIIEYELKRAQSLRQSILKCAFEGKLVSQNPDDEPASILLERIKAEKAKVKKSKQLEMF